jgi:excisionase family DNA binding protein
MIEKLLSVKEVCAITGEHVMTTYRRIREGQLRAVRVGTKSIRVPEPEVRRLITEMNPVQEGNSND